MLPSRQERRRRRAKAQRLGKHKSRIRHRTEFIPLCRHNPRPWTGANSLIGQFVGPISMAPGSTVVGVLGIIIWVRGMPGWQSAGGHSLQRSPRLNQPLVVGRQEWQPVRLPAIIVTTLNKISFFIA